MDSTHLDIAAINSEVIDATWKGVPGDCGFIAIDQIGSQGWNIVNGDIPFPALVMRASSIQNNLDVMTNFCAERGISFAPHGKTSMAPQLFQRQLEAGAWGITCATVQQLQVYRRFGLNNVLFANQIVGANEIAYVGQQLRHDPTFEMMSLVDSVAAVNNAVAIGRIAQRPAQVLLEIGYGGGRSGARNDAEVDAIVAAIQTNAQFVELRGIETYEGLLPTTRSPINHEMDALFDQVRNTTRRLAKSAVLPDGYIVSGGGSQAFDLVVDRLLELVPSPKQFVLRSGCYITHDHGFVDRVSPLANNHTVQSSNIGEFEAALELWTRVSSQPEHGLAIITCGKRDAPYDDSYPTALRRYPVDRNKATDFVVPVGAEVKKLNDQHGHLHFSTNETWNVGDTVVLGISHPCSAFDRWKLVFEVDDDYNVVGGIRTFF